MVTSTDIKFYVHSNKNAPQLNNAWGALAGVLDSCLITGYNAPTITSASASNNALTLNFGENHNLLAGQVLLISGSTQPEYNREFRIANIPTLSTVQIDLDNTFTSQPTGVLKAMLPPLGWVKEFSNGGKCAYRNANRNNTSRPFLRVVDQIDPVWGSKYAKYAKVGIVENMIDIDTLLGLQTPYDMVNPDKNWIGTGVRDTAYNGWAKWYYSRAQDVYVNNYYDSEGGSAKNKHWLIVGNGDWFYVLPSQIDSPYPNIYFFGELKTNTGEVYGLGSTLGHFPANENNATATKTALSSGAASFLLHMGKTSGIRAFGMQSGNNDGPGGLPIWYENINAGLVLSDVYVGCVSESIAYRAKMPAFKWLMNPYDANYELKTVEDTDTAYILKSVYASASATNSEPTTFGLVGFKLY